jgi:hypothetical protein
MQFGSALQRILQCLVNCNPTFGPPLSAKLDLADGYYRVPLSPWAALQLAVVMPNDWDESNLIAIPLSLPMGWAHSPPYFCAFTETIADLSNATQLGEQILVHKCLHESQQFDQPQHTTFAPSAIVLGSPNAPQSADTDVYIDDFIAMAQSPLHLPWLNALLHALDSVFQDADDSSRRQIILASKLQKGDACFSTSKRILGWDIDTVNMHISLPLHRLQSMTESLTNLLQHKRVSRKKWHKILGVLRSTTPALYGAHHLFSLLQHALTKATGRIRLTSLLRATFHEWLHLVATAAACPMPLASTVPRCPTSLAATDASKQGMGGFWVSNDAIVLNHTIMHGVHRSP